jgi:hypothetical protein
MESGRKMKEKMELYILCTIHYTSPEKTSIKWALDTRSKRLSSEMNENGVRSKAPIFWKKII